MILTLLIAAVSAFGVNYYPPFSVDYAELKREGLDVRKIMQDDVQHFRRLGLDGLRLHCFDRQISDTEGRFVENEHVKLLDYLIESCASNGIRTVLTPIAWWGGRWAADSSGFSNRFSMEQMTSDSAAIELEKRYLRDFASYYGTNANVFAFELINEPLYPESFADSSIVKYVNDLASVVRLGAPGKPIFYNSWRGRGDAVSRAEVDGESGSCYTEGLNHVGEIPRIRLSAVKGTSFGMKDAHLPMKRMIYEFDAPCTSASYLYPAMARLFRHQGVELAFQFQYDPLPLAEDNRNWKNHYLNLVYTPSKALSLAVAAEVFRRLPSGCPFERALDEMTFDCFKVDGRKNLSQMLTDADFIYTNDTDDVPRDASRLCRIYGVGQSSVAASDGRGAYFLDKVIDGVWRLQLYPDIFEVSDPYTYKTPGKTVVLARQLSFMVCLPDLGSSWRVRTVQVGDIVATAENGRADLSPGDYVLENVENYGSDERMAVARANAPRYVVPQLSGATREELHKERNLRLKNLPAGGAVPKGCLLFDVDACESTRLLETEKGCAVRTVGADDLGRKSVRVCVLSNMVQQCGYAGMKIPFDNLAVCRTNASMRGKDVVRIKARGVSEGDRLEVVFTQEDETSWGAELGLSSEWATYELQVAELRPKWDTVEMPWRAEKAEPDKFVRVTIGTGKWLLKDASKTGDYGFEISDIVLSRAGRDFDIRDFGAVAGDDAPCTGPIQRAIDSCSASGGGRVVVSGGRYFTGTIVLKDHVELHLTDDGVLVGSQDWRDWRDQSSPRHVNQYMCARHRTAALIFADEAADIAITGNGTIDGNGFAFVEPDPSSGSGQMRRVLGIDKSPPRLIFLAGCRRVSVSGVKVLNPPAGWSFWIHDCDDVVFHGVEICSDINIPNSDGIHVNCSRDVRISECAIQTGDDAIIVRANSASLVEDKPCERVSVSNCTLRSYSCGVRIAWLNDGEIRDCAFEDLRISNSVCGVGLFLPSWAPRNCAADQGRESTLVENCRFSNIVMEHIVARPLYVHIDPGSNTHVKAVRNLRFSDIAASGLMYPVFSAPRKGVVSDICLANCTFRKEMPGADGYPERAEVGFSKCQRFLSDLNGENVERLEYRNVKFE